MSKIYGFIYRQLIDANIKKDATVLDNVESMLAELKDTWVEAFANLKKKA